MGYFIGRLGRNRVCALYSLGVEIPSDYSEVLYQELDIEESWRLRPQTNLSRSESFKIIIIPEQEGYHPILFYLQFYVAFRFYGVPYMYPM